MSSKPIMLERVHLDAVTFASKEAHRYQITGLHVLPDGTTEATNGHYLCRVGPSPLDSAEFPPVDGAGDKPLPEVGVVLPTDAVKGVLKWLPKRASIPILAAAHVGMNGSEAVKVATTDLESSPVASIKPVAGTFPNADNVIPEVTEESHITIGLDPAYLATIADFATKHGGRRATIAVSFDKEQPADKPVTITFTTDGGIPVTIVLMPKRLA